jgi:hypothetical protein
MLTFSFADCFCLFQSGDQADDLKHNMAQLAADVHSMSSFALLQTVPGSASAFAGASDGVRLAVMTRATSGVASLQDGELEVPCVWCYIDFEGQ